MITSQGPTGVASSIPAQKVVQSSVDISGGLRNTIYANTSGFPVDVWCYGLSAGYVYMSMTQAHVNFTDTFPIAADSPRAFRLQTGQTLYAVHDLATGLTKTVSLLIVSAR